LAIGVIFILSGWGKLHHLDKVTEFFAALGIPAPGIQAPFVATVELVCGVLVLIGLFTRIAAIPLICTMIVAILTAKLKEITMISDLFSMFEYLYIILLLWLSVAGAGAVSVDCWRCCRHKKNEA
jgi:putative oxidoreductase